MAIPVQETIHIPLRSSDRVLGVLSVDRGDLAGAFTTEDEEMLVQFAGYAAVALANLENAKQQERTRQTLADELAALKQNLNLLEASLPELDDRQRELTRQMERSVKQARLHLSQLERDD